MTIINILNLENTNSSPRYKSLKLCTSKPQYSVRRATTCRSTSPLNLSCCCCQNLGDSSWFSQFRSLMEILSISIVFASSLMILYHLVLADSVHPCLFQMCGWDHANSYTPIHVRNESFRTSTIFTIYSSLLSSSAHPPLLFSEAAECTETMLWRP